VSASTSPRRSSWSILCCALALATSCAPALREPRPLAVPAHDARDAAALLAEARALYAQRPDLEAVRRSEGLFVAAAGADPGSVEALYGAIQAKLWLANHERDGGRRAELATSAVEAGQLCARAAPGAAPCDYGLALALGVQARERPSTATEGLKLMTERLRAAAAAEPALDHAGPERVLAILLVRAPAWPIGPGDPESALERARAAAARAPEHPPNQLALGEALLANGAVEEGRAAVGRGLELARARAAVGDPDAPEWVREGETLLRRVDGTS
jgi:hypothetical protein